MTRDQVTHFRQCVHWSDLFTHHPGEQAKHRLLGESGKRLGAFVYRPDSGWIAHLREAGSVTEEEMHAGLLVVWKIEAGVPGRLTSCHTAKTGGYVIEGHVPAADIDRLLLERPDARGLAVPGMPYGSPGMGPEMERDAYDVVLFRADGSTEVWTAYPAA